MLTLYFSATGNSEYIAQNFSRRMDAKCLSIEEDADFASEINASDTIAFCYPVYGSRVPRIMREFVARYMGDLQGKKIIIFATQMLFSGDGARVFADMFGDGSIEVIYAEHFKMPNNMGNLLIFPKPSDKAIKRCFKKADAKMAQICNDIKNGIVKKRGFAKFSQFIGNMQGKAWQGDSRKIAPSEFSAEHKAKNSVKIHEGCTVCDVCVHCCPMKNLANENGAIVQMGNCTLCYRCVNMCPNKAITSLVHIRPRWQYKVHD